jgi:hypothetical protein
MANFCGASFRIDIFEVAMRKENFCMYEEMNWYTVEAI